MRPLSPGLLAFAFCVCSSAQERGLGEPIKNDTSSNEPDKRVALVIGNAAYDKSPLANPVNDANDMASALKSCGFDTTLVSDSDLRAMKEAVERFSSRIPRSGVTLFFYAGHAIQVDGRNYLVPIGADPKSASDIEFDCFDMNRVLAKLDEGEARLNMIILDACRDNPFARSWTRSTQQGLASMDAPPGTILWYATSPGSVALDGKERNGIYSGYLLKHMLSPGADVVDIFRKTSDDVRTATKGRQVPWLVLSYTGNFSFVPHTPAINDLPAATMESNMESAIRRPIEALFASWENMDIRSYLAQWTASAQQIVKGGAARSFSEIQRGRETDFKRFKSVDVISYEIAITESSSNTAKARVVYSMRFVRQDGKVINEKDVAEAYELTYDASERLWKIQTNWDYLPK